MARADLAGASAHSDSIKGLAQSIVGADAVDCCCMKAFNVEAGDLFRRF